MEPHYSNQTWTYDVTGPKPVMQTPVRRKNVVPVLLFIATVLSTIWAGCLHQNIDVFAEPWLFYRGLPFALTLLLILGVHESGHYVLCRIHGVPATVPYFIPMPNFLGTMGAFIRIKGAITSRIVLLDIGMAGPLAGFVIALPAAIIGFRMSEIVPIQSGQSLLLGQSVLTWILETLLVKAPPPGYMIALHPVGFAGYIGLFVTAMNLLPIGQLDGSHIISALFGERQMLIAKITVFLLFILGVFWQGWLIWAILLVFLGMKHQVIRYDARSIDPLRRFLAWTTIVIFFLTFVPIPFRFGSFNP